MLQRTIVNRATMGPNAWLCTTKLSVSMPSIVLMALPRSAIESSAVSVGLWPRKERGRGEEGGVGRAG